MKKSIYNQQTGISYSLCGDYYLPDLEFPSKDEKTIGIWGQQHLRYIKAHQKNRYITLLTSGNLNAYLFDLNEQAENMLSLLVEQMAASEGVDEQLKKCNQMKWIEKMNSFRCIAIDIINNDFIFR